VILSEGITVHIIAAPKGRPALRHRANRQATCAQCGAQFTARTFNHKYCSIACTSAAAEWAYKERNATPEGFFKRLIRSNHKRKGLSWKYLMKLYNDQQGRCAISGVKMTTIVNNGHVLTNVSIDRIDSTKEYERGNIQLLCHIVNVMKHNMTKEQLIEWCWQIIDHKEA